MKKKNLMFVTILIMILIIVLTILTGCGNEEVQNIEQENNENGVAEANQVNSEQKVNEQGDLTLRFDNTHEAFSDGLVSIYKDGKYGVIDKKGNIVINFEYDNIGDFSEDLFSAGKDNKYGYIDKEGNVVIDFQYNFTGEFSEGLASVKKNNNK